MEHNGEHERMTGGAGLIEREGQLASLASLAAQCASGRGRVVLVTGPVASGKSELLDVVAERGTRSGFRVVNLTCSASESDLPFGVVSQLVRKMDLPFGVAERVERLMGVDAGEQDIAHELHSLCREVLDLAEDAPVLIALDDVQHADPLSLRWLLYLSRRLESAKVLLVFTETAVPRHTRSPLHVELLRHPRCHLVHLAPLSVSGVAELFAEDPAVPPARAAAAHLVTGGNPLLALGLLDDLRSSDLASECIVPGPGFRQAVLSCLYRCPPPVLSVARALAVLGGPATPGSLGALAGVDVESARLAVDVMTAAGLLDGGRFRHCEARTAVLDEVSAQHKRSLHLAAARLLHDSGALAVDVAPHLVEADPGGSPWMLPVLEQAAEHALRHEQVESAVRCLELAHRVCADDRGRTAITAKLVRAEWRVNPAAAARRLTALTEAMRADGLGDRDVTDLVGKLLWHGRVDEATEALDRVRRSGQGRSAQEAADLRAAELWVLCSYPSLTSKGSTLIDLARRDTRPAGLTTGLLVKSTAALAHVLTSGASEHTVADAEHVMQADRYSDVHSWAPDCAMPALLALVYADRLDIAQSWCDRLLEESRTRGTAVSQAMFTAVRAEIALRKGELAIAFDHARAAITLMPPAAWGTGIGFPLGCLISAATRMGRHDVAAAHLGHPVPDALFQSRDGLHYLHARGEHYLATGRYYAALADFLSCGELVCGWGLDLPNLVPWRTSAARAWLHPGGNRDEARRLINEQLAKLGPDSSRTRGVALRLLAATSQAHSRTQVLTEAVAILEDCGDQYELACALTDLSHAHRVLREHRRAWTVTRRAWHVAKTCDAEELCQELLPSRAEPDVTVLPASGVDRIASLSDAERRVAALAVVGYTNRQIADKLFITPSTIEQHLTRVYRKLKVKHRRDLPVDLHTYLPSSA
ncbi:MAG: AAA family ATPase [Umezawaea sp.]